MQRDFDKGVTFVMNNLGVAIGNRLSQTWLDDVNMQVSEMCEAMIAEAEKRSKTDDKHLQGWIFEIWHKYSFNLNANIHLSENVASIPSSEGYASADNLVQNKHGETIASFSLKSDGTAKDSYKDQAKTPWEDYLKVKAKANKAGKEYQAFDDFLKERKIKNDDSAYMSKYQGQGKVINSDMLEKAKQLAYKKYINALGDGKNTELSIQAKRYLDVYNSLTDFISDGEGNESIPLSHKSAMKLANAAKQANIDKELLAECGLDVDTMITSKDIFKEACTAGLSATVFSMIISVVPIIIDVIAKITRDEGINISDIEKYGLKALSDTARSFLTGSITAAVTSCCKTGKLGQSLNNANTTAISALVTIVLGTALSGIKLTSGKITKKEMVQEIMQMYTTTFFSFVGGTILTCICQGFPFAYLIGSFIGSVVGGFAYKLENCLIISFCKEYDCTFFGLVEQDYTLPLDVLEEMGLDKFGFEIFNYDCFKFDKFEPERFNPDLFEYERFGIDILRRDLIGVYKIGYVR